MAINRIKIMLVEKQRPVNGWQNSLENWKIQFQDGVRIRFSQHWTTYTK